jgi:hypothetical protein
LHQGITSAKPESFSNLHGAALAGLARNPLVWEISFAMLGCSDILHHAGAGNLMSNKWNCGDFWG